MQKLWKIQICIFTLFCLILTAGAEEWQKSGEAGLLSPGPAAQTSALDPTPTAMPTPRPDGVGVIKILPPMIQTTSGSHVYMDVRVNTGNENLGAFSFQLNYDTDIISVDKTQAEQGIESGSEKIIIICNTRNPGALIIAGYVPDDQLSGPILHLFRVHFRAMEAGVTTLELKNLTLVSDDYMDIGTPYGEKGHVLVQENGLTPTPWQVESCTYEAENATWNRGLIEKEHDGYSGSGYVNTENRIGNWLEFEFEAPSSRKAALRFFFANGTGHSRPASIFLNGVLRHAELAFPSTFCWDHWMTETVFFHLLKGKNTIRLYAKGWEGLPNLDKLELTFPAPVVTPKLTASPSPDSYPVTIILTPLLPSGLGGSVEVSTPGSETIRTITHSETIMYPIGTRLSLHAINGSIPHLPPHHCGGDILFEHWEGDFQGDRESEIISLTVCGPETVYACFKDVPLPCITPPPPTLTPSPPTPDL